MKKKKPIWKQVIDLQTKTKKDITIIENEFNKQLELLQKVRKKKISACTRNYGKASFPLLAKYKTIALEQSKSADPKISLSNFLLLLLISENLFYRLVTTLKSSNDREQIKVELLICTESLFKIIISNHGDGSNLSFEILANFNEIFDQNTDSLVVSGEFFIGSHTGPNRSGRYDESDALKKILDIFMFHFSK